MTGPGDPPAGPTGQLGEADRALWVELLGDATAGLRTLPDKPEETSEATVRALWHLAAGDPLSVRRASERPLPALDDPARDRLRNLVGERLGGRPLAHLTERQSFMGIEMLAGPGALIPRRETEILARAAVDLLRSLADAGEPIVAVDVCTGSGNLAAVLALADPRATVWASDLSADAVDLARQNMTYLGIGDRVNLRVGDLFTPFDTDEFRGKLGLLTCNPPYISTGKMSQMDDEIVGHEPALAFDGGPLGIRILQRLISESPSLLKPGGWLAFEVGLGQGPAVERRLTSSGDYRRVDRVADAGGQVRVLLAQRQ